ncbi:MAG: zinc transporter ZupT [Rikenellaceae bacterium]|jgi:ZIP family zinc transporter|nr:zinc transporter ZupT [Rikenellaceae bacterium]
MDTNVLYALGLTLFAGLATGIGSCIAFFAKHTDRKFLSFSLGFSAGVMIYISFVDIFQQARVDLGALHGAKTGDIIATLCLFGGIGLAAAIDKLVPSADNPHEIKNIEDMGHRPDGVPKRASMSRLRRAGIVTALAVGLHNFPEGVATFMSAIGNPSLGLAIAVAIAIHNIPEGIAVSVPVFYATGSRRKAFWYSFLSGLSEPVGALLAWLLLMPFMSVMLMSCTFAAVAGIMVYISFDELLPAAHEYGEHHIAIYGLISGMAVMAASLIMLM